MDDSPLDPAPDRLVDELPSPDDALVDAEPIVGHSDALDDLAKAAEKAGKAAKAVSKVTQALGGLGGQDSPGAEKALGTTAAGLEAMGLVAAAAGASPVFEVIEDVARVGSGAAHVASGVAGVIDGLVDAFSDDTPEVRATLLDARGTPSGFRVERFEVVEALHEPYRCTLRVSSEDLTLAPQELLGANAGLALERSGRDRNLYLGIVTRVEALSGEAASVAAEITLEPALAALRHGRNTRIFQDMSAAEILEELLAVGLSVYGREVEVDLGEDYLPREYCVQHEESDLAFVQRLCSEEGIALSFARDPDALVEKVRLTDRNARLSPAPTSPVKYEARRDLVPGTASLRDFYHRSELGVTGASLADYDWTRPALLQPEFTTLADDQNRIREVFDHDSPALLHDYRARAYGGTMLEARTDLRTMQWRMEQELFIGRGDVEGLFAGTRFELEGHSEPLLDREYLVVRVRHVGHRRAEDEQSPYENEIVCVRADRRYLPPPPRARPRVPGFVTAQVVGPEGEEIHTDEHGRIKVRFRFDRDETPDDRASCWLRVAQAWAGPGFGAVFIPRVGMEVMVQFEGGNPDRPLCVGCLYNGVNAPPLDLPRERTQTVLRTRSSPDSDGYNELRFEDATGEELIGVHAQRDMTVTVERDQTTTVERDQTTCVHRNEALSVDGGRTVSIGGTFNRTVKKATTERYEEGWDVRVSGAASLLAVDAVDCQTKVQDGNYALEVSGGRVDVTSDIEIKHVSRNSLLVVNPSVVRASADRAVSLHCPESHVALEPSRLLLTHGGSTIELLDGKIKLMNGDSGIVISNKEIALTCQGTEIKLTSALLKLTTAGQAVLEAASKLTAAGGGGTVELAGGQVKLN